MDVKDDIIKKSIRWKQNQLLYLKKKQYFEPEVERRKRVRLKERRIELIDQFEDFISFLGKTTLDMKEGEAKWNEKKRRENEKWDDQNSGKT
jgi:hypothetical protein